MNITQFNSKVQWFLIYNILFLNFSYGQNCQGSSVRTVLGINNVSTLIKDSGDLWWDGDNGQYIVPRPPVGEVGVSALFAGGIWMGGLDQSGNLKLAAQTYGASSGSYDYYPGPLDENGMTTSEQCSQVAFMSRHKRYFSLSYSTTQRFNFYLTAATTRRTTSFCFY